MAGYSAGYSESKISNPEKSFDHPRHLKSGVPPPPGTNWCKLNTVCKRIFLLAKFDVPKILLVFPQIHSNEFGL